MRGTLPDMFSDSDRYIKLLNIYRNKAGQDADQVYRRVQTHLESIGKSPVSNLNLQKSKLQLFSRIFIFYQGFNNRGIGQKILQRSLQSTFAQGLRVHS